MLPRSDGGWLSETPAGREGAEPGGGEEGLHPGLVHRVGEWVWSQSLSGRGLSH